VAAGATRALNHVNKKAKGEFVRALAESGSLANITSVDELCAWGVAHGWQLEAGVADNSSAGREITLLV
jgi:hypothetical protein